MLFDKYLPHLRVDQIHCLVLYCASFKVSGHKNNKGKVNEHEC